MASRYAETYAGWRRDPEGFWREAARAIEWIEPPRAIFNAAGPYGRWFPDASLNACFNCVDRHVAAGRGDQAAIIYDAPVIAFKKTITYAELLDEVRAMAAVMRDFGVGKGDRVLLYLPMLPRAHIAMLACARLGAIHCVVRGGVSADDLAACIDDAAPKLILIASCAVEGEGRIVPHKPLVDAAIERAGAKPEAVLVWQRPRLQADVIEGRDHDWEALVEAAEGREIACEPMAATDPLSILHTSDSTGKPKGIVRDTGGTLVALASAMSAVYDVAPGETFWCAADVGEPIGHSLAVYAPLLIGATTVCYEGELVGSPDAGGIWRACAEWGVVSLLTMPATMRVIEMEDSAGALAKEHDLSGLRALFLAWRTDASTAGWARETSGVPVLAQWWESATGWYIAGNSPPDMPNSAMIPMPGYALAVVDGAERPVPTGKTGDLVVELPLPPGCLPTPWRKGGRARENDTIGQSRVYRTAEAGSLDGNGYVFLFA